MEAQTAQVAQGQASGGALVQAPSAPQAPPAAVAREGSGVVERYGYQCSLEDILAAQREDPSLWSVPGIWTCLWSMSSNVRDDVKPQFYAEFGFWCEEPTTIWLIGGTIGWGRLVL